MAEEGEARRMGSPPDTWLGVSAGGADTERRWKQLSRAAESSASMRPARCPCGVPLPAGSGLGSELPGATGTNSCKRGA